ncbi:MAG: hypothetical protein KDD48_00555 [Bdellovibrionales bacterium]|nr:hypothetical protein [Bdellovibrionales bacterium]
MSHIETFSKDLKQNQWQRRQGQNPTLLKDFALSEPKAAYVFFTNYKDNFRFAWHDEKQVNQISVDLTRKFKSGSPYDVGMLDKVLTTPDLEYVHEVAMTFMPPDEAQFAQTPLGLLKVGYVLPGKISQSVRLGQGFRYLIPLWWVLSAVLVIFIGLNDTRQYGGHHLRHPQVTAVADPQKTEEAELTWLEDETGKTEPIFVDEQGRSWKILLDRDTLVGWTPKGNWYVNDGYLFGRPWGASAVRQGQMKSENYEFQLKAQKMAGSDGFVILFSCNAMPLIWVLGGWGNTRTEVLGYPRSSNSFKIQKNDWYFIEVRVNSQNVEGFINGELNFRLPKNEIKYPSPNVGFQNGLGVGVWSTLSKYADMRLLEY